MSEIPMSPEEIERAIREAEAAVRGYSFTWIELVFLVYVLAVCFVAFSGYYGLPAWLKDRIAKSRKRRQAWEELGVSYLDDEEGERDR